MRRGLADNVDDSLDKDGYKEQDGGEDEDEGGGKNDEDENEDEEI